MDSRSTFRPISLFAGRAREPRIKFSKPARADFFEALPLVRPDLAGEIPPVHRREDRRPSGKSRAGRPRDPAFALYRFSRYFLALEQFEAARDLRDAEKTAKKTGVNVRTVLRAKGRSGVGLVRWYFGDGEMGWR